MHVCTSADRSGRPGSMSVLSVYSGRSDRPTVREFTLRQSCGRPSRPTVFPNCQKYDRWRSTGPVDRQLSEKSDRLQQLYFLTVFFCWDLTPTNFSGCYLVFSSPINRWSFQHDNIQDLHIRFTSFQKPFILEKIFIKAKVSKHLLEANPSTSL